MPHGSCEANRRVRHSCRFPRPPSFDVTRWIKSGHLKAKLRGTARTPQQNGDSYLIQEKDARRFILEHPTDIDLRKVDQLWFLDVITNGLVRAA